jgi:hypothetical protein
MLDVFNSSAFSLTSLTGSINKLPYKPSRLGAMGLFEDAPISTLTVVIEEANGVLKLLPTLPRGAAPTQATSNKRTARSLTVPHIPYNDVVRPEDIQGVRMFGSDNQMETVVNVVNNKLTSMRQNHEVTHEYHRIGAAKGIILDADGSTTVYNLFTEFGVTQDSVAFALGTADTDVRLKCMAVKRLIETELGASPYSYIHCLCSSGWFDKLISHTDVKTAYERYQEGAMLRNDPRKGFLFADIFFEEYSGSVGSVPFIATNEAHFFPVGVPGLFKQHWAPADFMETANTMGLPIYAKSEPAEFNRGAKLHTQSNPLMLCTRPKVLVKGTTN